MCNKKNKQTKTTGYIECEGKQQAYHIFEIIFSWELILKAVW